MLTVVDILGWSDPYYKRFTSKTQQSLIIGTSRAAQGIVPEVFNMPSKYSLNIKPVYNFSFDIVYSPFGEVYYRAIRRKICDNSDDTVLVFIIAVDPMALSIETGMDKTKLREYDGPLAKISLYCRPQYGYLFRFCHPYFWHMNDCSSLHDDGWLEIKGIPMDSISICKRTELKMLDYNGFSITKSDYRLYWLEKTIDMLQQRGEIFMCRIPVSSEMREWEDGQWPEFDDDMFAFAESKGIRYFPFSGWSGTLKTTDGNHLYKDDARVFTAALCDSIAFANNLCRKIK